MMFEYDNNRKISLFKKMKNILILTLDGLFKK